MCVHTERRRKCTQTHRHCRARAHWQVLNATAQCFNVNIYIHGNRGHTYSILNPEPDYATRNINIAYYENAHYRVAERAR